MQNLYARTPETRPQQIIDRKTNIALAMHSPPHALSTSFCVPVAQLDRAPDYGSGGWGFEALRVHHFPSHAAQPA